MEKSLDIKLARIHKDRSCEDFILADAKDGDMAYGLSAPGLSPENYSSEFRFKTLDEYRAQIREVIKQGLVDIVLMSASTSEQLTLKEGLFENSPLTPAIRANDASDIWLAGAGAVYGETPSRPFRTATLDHALCGKANPLVMVLLAIPVFLSGLVLNTPMITVYRFGFYGFGFLLGYFVFAHDEVIERLTKLRFVLAPLAAALGVLYTVFYYGKNYADASAHLDVINSIPAVAFAWTAVLAFFACFKAWFDKETPFSRFMTKKSFGFYMFHYFGISAAALLIELYLPMPLFMKYLIVTLNGLAVGFAFPEVFGRIPVVRYLIMGIRKPK